jgi:hypothetical protein
MTTFVPITSAGQIPPIGRGAEHALWDLKERLSPVEFHRAKDVAAFANHLGGTLLIGAIDDGTGQIASFRPLTTAEADDYEKGIAQAIDNRCRPVPLINYERIHHREGLLLAVNVWPSIASVVGVRVRADAADGFGNHAYVFPVRLGNATSFLSTESLPMHMIPQLRRMLILLASIDRDEPVLYCPRNGNNMDVRILKIDELTNSIVLRKFDAADEAPWSMALDRIVTVFRADGAKAPYWRIMMHND